MSDGDDAEPGRLMPEMLTVAEAADVLRIGRTLAYQLARQYLAGDPDGLPVIRLGGCLRVPRRALDELIAGRRTPAAEIEADIEAAIDELLGDTSPAPTRSTPERSSPHACVAALPNRRCSTAPEDRHPAMTSHRTAPTNDRQVPASGSAWS